MSLAGDLQDFEITDLFQLIQLGQKDGVLKIETADDVGFVYLKNGKVAHAQTRSIQGEPAIDTLLGWKKGRFIFTPGEEMTQHTVDLPVQQVILEAARRIDELARIQKLIPSFDVVIKIVEIPQEGVEKIELNPREWKALSFVDGNLTVRQIARKSDIPEFETAKIFYGMISSGLVSVAPPKQEKIEEKKETKRSEPPPAKEPAGDGWLSRFFKKK